MTGPENRYKEAAEVLRHARYGIAFTGAGISVESGIPPFRGKDGLWTRYDPGCLDIDYFHRHPERSWPVIREIFYSHFIKARFNRAHEVLAEMEKRGMIRCVITQNIDNLHQEAGNREVFEFHGNSKKLTCTKCQKQYLVNDLDLSALPPRCTRCGGLIKPGFVFFGEGIPVAALQGSMEAARNADAVIIVGTTGEVMPAAQMPYLAKQGGATVIEVNTEPSRFTESITDIFLQGKATEAMDSLAVELFA
jgi:NAD-dependent deacetylase